MYNGYLIRINDRILPNRFIDRTSWRIIPMARRVVDSFFDVSGEYHEYLADHERTTIQFTLGEHKESDHALIMSFFEKNTNVTVEYYNDKTQLYEFGTFKIADLELKQKRTFDTKVWWDKTTVKLTEY